MLYKDYRAIITVAATVPENKSYKKCSFSLFFPLSCIMWMLGDWKGSLRSVFGFFSIVPSPLNFWISVLFTAYWWSVGIFLVLVIWALDSPIASNRDCIKSPIGQTLLVPQFPHKFFHCALWKPWFEWYQIWIIFWAYQHLWEIRFLNLKLHFHISHSDYINC